jgi:hypothetical protein
MYTLILVMYVQYANTSIALSNETLAERYKDVAACDSAGQNLQVKTAKDSPVGVGVADLRVGYICVPSGTIKPL